MAPLLRLATLLGLRNPELVVPVDEVEEDDTVLVPARTAPDVLEPEEPELLPFCASTCPGLLPVAIEAVLLPLSLPLLLLLPLEIDPATSVPPTCLPPPEVELPEDSSEPVPPMFQIPVP